MGDFRTFANARRTPARLMQPVVDPAAWRPTELSDIARCSYRISDRDIAELADGITSVRRRGVAIESIGRDDFPLDRFAGILGDVRRELIDGRGIASLRGFPVDAFSREEAAIAYIGLGCHIGAPMSQNKHGHILGHVKDLGGDYAEANTRGYMTRAEMRFHSDACDFVGLLCLKTSKAGGESRVASSLTVYNTILAQRPDLVRLLTEDLYRSRTGEINAGEQPFFKQPIFYVHDGFMSATGAGAAIDKAQQLPGVPKFTAAQQDAVALYRATVDQCAADIPFEPGDLQLLNNFVMLHTRRAYEDWPEPGRKRHLMRLWLRDPESRPIPQELRENRTGRGVHLAGVRLIAPLDVDAAAAA